MSPLKYIAFGIGALFLASLMAVGSPSRSAYANDADDAADARELVYEKICNPDNTIDDALGAPDGTGPNGYEVKFDITLTDFGDGAPATPVSGSPATELDFSVFISCGELITLDGNVAGDVNDLIGFAQSFVCDQNGGVDPCWEDMDVRIWEPNLPAGQLDRYDSDQFFGDEWCDGGPFGSEEIELDNLIDELFFEGLGCEIENFAAECDGDSCEGLITLTKTCDWDNGAVFPFDPNEFDIYFHWFGDGEDDTPIEGVELLGDLECEETDTFFIPAGALECFEDCSDGSDHYFVVEFPPAGVEVSFAGTDCEVTGEIDEDVDIDRPSGLDCVVNNVFTAATLTLTKVCDPADPAPVGAGEPTFNVTITEVGNGFSDDVDIDCGQEVVVPLPPGLRNR